MVNHKSGFKTVEDYNKYMREYNKRCRANKAINLAEFRKSLEGCTFTFDDPLKAALFEAQLRQLGFKAKEVKSE